MTPFIYIAIFIALFLLAFAFYFKEWGVAVISGMFLILIALYILNNGILGEYNFLISSVAIIMLCLGFYTMTRAILDKLQIWN